MAVSLSAVEVAPEMINGVLAELGVEEDRLGWDPMGPLNEVW